jgi:RNA-binding protein
MLDLSTIKILRAKAHHLKPLVLVGQSGVTTAVLAALEETLFTHELVKVRLRISDRDERKKAILSLADAVSAEIIKKIGSTVVLFRRNPESKKDWSKE